MVDWQRILLVGCFVLLSLGAGADRALAYPVPDDLLPGERAAEPVKKIVVDISEQRVTAYQGGAAVMRFPASTGRNGNTAAGSFRILNKRAAPKHARWGYSMPNWMGVYYVGSEWENGFHGLPVTEGGRVLWEDQIGSPASDGCIVLYTADMQRLYAWAEVGTPVEIQK